jgi:hypothetical protein
MFAFYKCIFCGRCTIFVFVIVTNYNKHQWKSYFEATLKLATLPSAYRTALRYTFVRCNNTNTWLWYMDPHKYMGTVSNGGSVGVVWHATQKRVIFSSNCDPLYLAL